MANHLRADLDDMVFENRERNYGAYFLRKRYPKNLSVALGLVVFFALVGGFGPLVAKSMGWIKAKEEKKEHIVLIDLSDVPPPPPITEKIEPPQPPPPPEIKVIEQVEFRIPEPSPDVDPADTATIHQIEELIDTNLGFADIEGDKDDILFTGIDDDEGLEVIIPTEPGPKDFVSVDQRPNPVNLQDIQKLVGYPTIAQQSNIEGKVLMRILVDKQGRYQKHIVSNSAHPILTEAIEKHISKLMFTPAIQGNRPIKFWVNVPFSFTLFK